MNVKDATAPEATDDRFDMIFARQKELMEKYHAMGIDVLPERFHIDDRECQSICKDFAWRVTEEFAEATDVEFDQLHAWEEAADALHFFVELLLINGISADDVIDFFELDAVRIYGYDRLDRIMSRFLPLDRSSIDERAYAVIRKLGLAMNCLKNKPWKQTQMETDVPQYRQHLYWAFSDWFVFAAAIGMTAGDVFDIYFKKSRVNEFRQRSQY
jgi:hypothetical protein